MILLLGASGYVGSEFARQLTVRDWPYRSISRADVDYTDVDRLAELIRQSGAEFLINSAGYTGKPNVDACERHKSECLAGNAVLPGTIRQACERTETPWGHVSSGCIFTGNRPDGSGFTESDPPNFSFRTDNCSWYSGCKALGEEVLIGAEQTYIWRLRIPFDHRDGARNYLSKVIRYPKLLEATNSISHLGEFVSACLTAWSQRIPFGTYNVTNTGHITTRQVTDLIRQYRLPEKQYEFFESEAEFMRLAAKTPRSNCVMDNTKLLQAGIPMSHVEEAVVRSLKNWEETGS